MIYRWDKYKPEPKSLLIRVFLFGMGIAIPVALIETSLYPNAIQENLSLATAAFIAFGLAGVFEESGKFIVVRFGAYSSRHFEEPADGLIYAAAAALGFASTENIVYVLSFGWQVILVRALFSNLAHVLFSSLWGYPLAMTKLGFWKHKSLVYGGLAAAVVAHGLFDFLFFTGTSLTYLVIPLFFGMVVLFILMFRRANRIAIYIEHRARLSHINRP
jgi:RsiW-degrading membrane proteinase PrsW (M82 family)